MSYNNVAKKTYGLVKAGFKNRDLVDSVRKINFNLPDGLTYFKHFKDRASLGDFTIGSRKGTTSVTRSATAPSSEIDSSERINRVIISNYLRWFDGVYGSTGFSTVDSNGHIVRGIVIERAATNLLTYTDGTNYAGAADVSIWTGWNTTVIPGLDDAVAGTPKYNNVLIPDLTSISGATSQRIQYTGVAGDTGVEDVAIRQETSVGSFATGDYVTISCWLRSQTGISGVEVYLKVVERDSSSVVGSSHGSVNFSSYISTEWKYFTHTWKLVDLDLSLVSAQIKIANFAEGDTCDIEIYGAQLEKGLRRSTTWIPTTTAALTRGAESLSYLNPGNSTAEQETIMMKVVPFNNFAADNTDRALYETSIKQRTIYQNDTDANGVTTFKPNAPDSTSSASRSTTILSNGVSYVICGVAYGPKASTNCAIFVNGILEDTDADNYVLNVWSGTNSFYIGSKYDNTNHFDGIIQAIAKWNRPLSNAEILDVSNKFMNL